MRVDVPAAKRAPQQNRPLAAAKIRIPALPTKIEPAMQWNLAEWPPKRTPNRESTALIYCKLLVDIDKLDRPRVLWE